MSAQTHVLTYAPPANSGQLCEEGHLPVTVSGAPSLGHLQRCDSLPHPHQHPDHRARGAQL